MIHVTKVRQAGNYVLHVTFADGTEGDADFSKDIENFEPFAPLKDPKLFAQAHVRDGTVVWSDELDVAAEHVYALAHRLPEPVTGEQVRANELEVSIRELRKMSGQLQEQVAESLAMTQGGVSRIENGAADAKLTTLRKYLGALGWDLEVAAVRGDKRVRLRGL